MCLRETGSRCSSNSEDFLSPAFRNFLDHLIHYPHHRGGAGSPTIVRVNAFSASQIIPHDCLLSLPSFRYLLSLTGAVQLSWDRAFMASMEMTCVPRSILVAKAKNYSQANRVKLNRVIHQRSGWNYAARGKESPRANLPLTGARIRLDLAQGYPAFVLSSVGWLVQHDHEVAVSCVMLTA